MSQPKSNEEAKELIKNHIDAMTALAILDTKSDLWEQACEELDTLLNTILAQKAYRDRYAWALDIRDFFKKQHHQQLQKAREEERERIASIKAVEILKNQQEQCDQDGIMVRVSRQALDELLDELNQITDVINNKTNGF